MCFSNQYLKVTKHALVLETLFHTHCNFQQKLVLLKEVQRPYHSHEECSLPFKTLNPYWPDGVLEWINLNQSNMSIWYSVPFAEHLQPRSHSSVLLKIHRVKSFKCRKNFHTIKTITYQKFISSDGPKMLDCIVHKFSVRKITSKKMCSCNYPPLVLKLSKFGAYNKLHKL